ncbi:hypothetical protein [Natrarchaeobaculum aegyptiacum]|uniref:Preprotein translocase subunit SecD n=1 Tax=Natrarchaeobaculum aegyptiacum TaxID=745377 RepID=A0A2Z2HWI7_9EURY|nr:hypothetical protein [Natrarchaeobaculum aegyptiacum]ARS91223.1 hypothetical protein B1756_16800 [Natrarchaeobaculum aegyptiacum]
MVSRRSLLATGGLALTCTAGCLDFGDETADPADDDASDDTDGETALEARDPDAPLVTTIDPEAAVDDDVDAEEIVLATYGDVVDVGSMDHDDAVGHYVPVELTDDAAESFVDRLESFGGLERPMDVELTVHVDDEGIGSYLLGQDFAQSMADGEWDGSFTVVADDESQLEDVLEQFE